MLLTGHLMGVHLSICNGTGMPTDGPSLKSTTNPFDLCLVQVRASTKLPRMQGAATRRLPAGGTHSRRGSHNASAMRQQHQEQQQQQQVQRTWRCPSFLAPSSSTRHVGRTGGDGEGAVPDARVRRTRK